jgi:hypothetical protein
MTKQISKNVKQYLDDVAAISSLKKSRLYKELHVPELLFDLQMLSNSKLYRASRSHYLALGGKFKSRICSTLRSLSSDDIFKFEIEYAPAESEVLWFSKNPQFGIDAEEEMKALQRFTDVSVFHEQNHRVIWHLLPAAPADRMGFRRFLNFAESLVVTLDAALGDEVGGETSEMMFRLNLLYRPAGEAVPANALLYRRYLVALFFATYMLLEWVDKRDIPKAVNFVFPDQTPINRQAVKRALELSGSFTEVTNPQWQSLYWRKALRNLQNFNKGKGKTRLRLPADPLDLGVEFALVHEILDYFDLSQPLSARGKSGTKDKKIKS